MFDEKLELVASRVGPLAERAVEALESIAESLGTMSRTADLQAQILTQHQAQPQRRELSEDQVEYFAARLNMTPEHVKQAHKQGTLPTEFYLPPKHHPLRSVPGNDGSTS